MKKLARELKNIALIIAGIFAAGMGLKGFLMSSRFIDGGVTGISMLLADVVGFPLAIWILVINLSRSGRDRDRRAARQQDQPPLESRGRHSHSEHFHFPGSGVFPGDRDRALFDPHLFRRFQDD